MLRVFQICFLAGTAYTVISFLIGQLFDFVDFNGDVDFDSDIPGVTISPLKPIIIVAFTTVFGGVGIISTNLGLPAILALLIAAASGLFVANIIYKFVVVPLYKAQNTSSTSQTELIGHKAKVKLGIIGDGFGRISYVINSNTYTAPAKSINGKDISKDTDVIIIEIRKNVFFVDKFYF